jgi:hypothetical protein
MANVNGMKTREFGLISCVSSGSPRVGTNVHAVPIVPAVFRKVLTGASPTVESVLRAHVVSAQSLCDSHWLVDRALSYLCRVKRGHRFLYLEEARASILGCSASIRPQPERHSEAELGRIDSGPAHLADAQDTDELRIVVRISADRLRISGRRRSHRRIL